jgi:chloramphenicol-sensitive protein RarD
MNSAGRSGVWFGAAAYVLWGSFPLYFRLLERSGAVEILLHRISWSLLVCLAVVAVTRGWVGVRSALGNPRWVTMLGVAASFLAVNWGVYIYAVNSGHVIEASLGYYINPLVTVVLGVVVLRERLRRLQWAAVGVGTVAVAVLTAAYGRPPWIALVLALTFGMYGLLKNRIGGSVGAVASLTTETVLLAPLAAVGVAWTELSGQGHFTDNPPWQGLLLASSGVATVIPLLLFAASARRVPLSTLGLLQYLTPTLQLLCGVLLLGEHMPAVRSRPLGRVRAGVDRPAPAHRRHARLGPRPTLGREGAGPGTRRSRGAMRRVRRPRRRGRRPGRN